MNLIEAIDETIRRVEAGEVEYEWARMGSCNCGVLAQTILGIDAQSLVSKKRKQMPGVWSDCAAKCKATGIPIGSIFETLTEFGMSLDDIVDLENLSNPYVAARAGLELRPSEFFPFPICRSRVVKKSFLGYMKAWRDLISEQSEINATASMEIPSVAPVELVITT